MTGLDQPFFLGGDSKLAGFMHYKPPRWTEEYAKMDDRDLYRRIQDDLEELLARAYPTYSDERQLKFSPNYWRKFPITYVSRLHSNHESVAESLCPGLMKRMITINLKARALAEYYKLVDQLLTEEPKHAAKPSVHCYIVDDLSGKSFC
jgi:hypothetical protein